jgi:amino acid adenylation domain-containing protein
MHHIISDGWSIGVLMKELAAIMAGAELPALQIQYADYAVWQREQALDGQLAYWRETLADAPATLALPLDRPRPRVQSSRGATSRFAVPAAVASALRQLAQCERATLFMTLLAAFDVLLHRYSGQSDFVVGSPVAGRGRPEVEELIGLFVNTVAIRADASGDPSFRELLARVKAAVTGAIVHQDLPFELLVDELKPERSLAYTPLFQVVFALRQKLDVDRFGGLRAELVPFDSGTAKFDLTVTMEETAGALTGAFEYNADLFDAATIARMAAHFQQLLESIAAAPDTRVSALPMLSSDERERMLVTWNETARPIPDATVINLFREQVRLRPHAVALYCDGDTFSYAELGARVDDAARVLREHGAGPEQLVAIVMERGVDAVIAILGVLASGAAYLPIDPAWPDERIAFILGDAKPNLVWTADGVARRASDNAETNLAYVIYTSGSTGQPKGVMIEHRGLTNFARAFGELMEVTPSSRVLQFASLTFDASVLEIFTALTNGACLCIAERDALMPVEPLVDTIARQRITTALLPPSVLALLDPRETPSLRVVASGGEACSAALASRWREHVRFVNAYGPTEITVAATADPDTDGVSIGRPIANATAFILGPGDEPVPPGVVGELCIGGAGVARGYLWRPELTAQRFVANPFGEGRLYRTGDLARFRADGRIEFAGRADRQVKLRGFRIELGEIEAAIEHHPAVEECAVLLRSDRLVAYVVASDAGADLRAFVRTQLPEHMVPSAFVTLPRLPLNSHGKVDAAALPEDEPRRSALVPPRTPVEQQLAALWAEVLGVEVVGIDDDFFALGGHSLLATQLVSRVNREFDVALPLRSLLESPTIADLAIAVATCRAAEQEEGELAAMLAQLDTLSDAEVTDMLRNQ